MKTILRIFVLTAFTLGNMNTLIAQWVLQTAEAHETLVDIVMLDSLKAVAIGHRNAILRTTDAGSSWINETIAISATYEWNSLSFYDSLNGAIIGDHRLMTTSDGGINWELRTVPTTTQTCLSVLQTGPSDISVGTDSGWVYSSSDTGKTWLSEKISAGPVRSLFVWRGMPLIGVSKYALTPYSLCIQYVIPPPFWSESILPNFLGLGSEGFDAEFCNGGSTGFIVGVQGDLIASPAVLRKTITDTMWRLTTAGISRMGTLFGVSAPSANVIFVCGSTGLIYKSSNGGDNWRDQSVLKSRDIKAIYFYNELRGFAVGDSGTILYTSNGGENPVGVKENVQGSTKFELNQNHPNPFNPTTVISFQLPARSYTTLKIYDLIGREVATIVSEELTEGNHIRQWNAEGLPSGVYFYRLQTGTFTETKKLILLR